MLACSHLRSHNSNISTKQSTTEANWSVIKSKTKVLDYLNFWTDGGTRVKVSNHQVCGFILWKQSMSVQNFQEIYSIDVEWWTGRQSRATRKTKNRQPPHHHCTMRKKVCLINVYVNKDSSEATSYSTGLLQSEPLLCTYISAL